MSQARIGARQVFKDIMKFANHQQDGEAHDKVDWHGVALNEDTFSNELYVILVEDRRQGS